MTNPLLIFKNNLPNLTVLKLFSQDFSALKEQLQKKFKQAPMMFIGMQLAIDISEFDSEKSLSLDVETLIAFLQGEGINPVALISDRASFRETLVKTGLGVLPVLHSKNERILAVGEEQVEAAPANTAAATVVASDVGEDAVAANSAQTTLEEPRKTFESYADNQDNVIPHNQIIRTPVRSGQRVYTQGDLTVVGSVSPGAEVIAEGSIHVYGKLSGRAIAGAKGNEEAAIFCQNLDAELVSIAGNYKQLEDIQEEFRNQRVQISLEGEKLCFFSL